MQEKPVEFVVYHASTEESFHFDIPTGWDVIRSEPTVGASYYVVPIGDDRGVFSVYRTLTNGDTADTRLALERESVESLEIVSRTEVELSSRLAERLVYVIEEMSPRTTVIDEMGMRQDVGPRQQQIYADFVFFAMESASYVVGYKIDLAILNDYTAVLAHMLESFTVTA